MLQLWSVEFQTDGGYFDKLKKNQKHSASLRVSKLFFRVSKLPPMVCFETSCAVLSHCFNDRMCAQESAFFV